MFAPNRTSALLVCALVLIAGGPVAATAAGQTAPVASDGAAQSHSPNDHGENDSVARANGSTHEHLSLRVTTEDDALVADVEYEGEGTATATVTALEGSYEGEGTYAVDGRETIRLPLPDEPTRLNLTVEADHVGGSLVIDVHPVSVACTNESAVVATVVLPGTANASVASPGPAPMPEVACSPGNGTDGPTGPGNWTAPDDRRNASEWVTIAYDGAENASEWVHGRSHDAYDEGYERARGAYRDGYERASDAYREADERKDRAQDDAEAALEHARADAEAVAEDGERFADEVGEDVNETRDAVEDDAREDVDEAAGTVDETRASACDAVDGDDGRSASASAALDLTWSGSASAGDAGAESHGEVSGSAGTSATVDGERCD